MLYRFTLDLAIPEAAYLAISPAVKTAFRDRIRDLKALAVKINAGQPNEEMTVTATFHKCYHDEGKPCEASQDI